MSASTPTENDGTFCRDAGCSRYRNASGGRCVSRLTDSTSINATPTHPATTHDSAEIFNAHKLRCHDQRAIPTMPFPISNTYKGVQNKNRRAKRSEGRRKYHIVTNGTVRSSAM